MDDRSQEESRIEETGLDSFIKKLYRPGPLVFLFTIAFIGLLSLAFFLLNSDTPPPEVIAEPPVQPIVERVYEEDTSSEMEDMVKQADLAIIETMRASKLDMSKLDLLDIEIRTLDGRGYHYQVLQLPGVADQNVFFKNLQERLLQRVPNAALKSNNTSELTIAINDLPTHRLLLEFIPLTLPSPPLPQGPQLAIVIDDIGEDMKVLNGLVNLDFPVTLAVWPNASFTRAAVELIAQKRRDLIIHFPMEPKDYPKYNPGDDALFVSMNADAIIQRVKENVAQIPEAIGVNNHMGSQFTGNTLGMQIALAEFKRHGLFFLDSLTTSKSVARNAARHAGIAFYERDIFIDNVKDVNAIILQLKKAENVALKQGHSIAIGHPYPETLAALKSWNIQRNSTIQVLPLSRMSAQ